MRRGLVVPTIMDLPIIPFQFSLIVEEEYVVKMRLEPAKVSPAAYHAVLGLESFVSKSSKLEVSLLGLVKMRASQINGCARHSKDARVNGETEQRLYALSAWRETSFFTNRERAALAWTEALTLIAEGRAPDEVYAEARKEFGEEELVNLSIAIITINGWNRLAMGFRKIQVSISHARLFKPVIAGHHSERTGGTHEFKSRATHREWNSTNGLRPLRSSSSVICYGHGQKSLHQDAIRLFGLLDIRCAFLLVFWEPDRFTLDKLLN